MWCQTDVKTITIESGSVFEKLSKNVKCVVSEIIKNNKKKFYPSNFCVIANFATTLTMTRKMGMHWRATFKFNGVNILTLVPGYVLL